MDEKFLWRTAPLKAFEAWKKTKEKEGIKYRVKGDMVYLDSERFFRVLSPLTIKALGELYPAVRNIAPKTALGVANAVFPLWVKRRDKVVIHTPDIGVGIVVGQLFANTTRLVKVGLASMLAPDDEMDVVIVDNAHPPKLGVLPPAVIVLSTPPEWVNALGYAQITLTPKKGGRRK